MGEFLDFFKTKKNLTSLLLLGIIILGLPIGIRLLKQQQILKSRAQREDPIVFVPSETLFQQTDGKWVTTRSNISFKITSPFGPQGGVSPTPAPTATPPPGEIPTATPVPRLTSTPSPVQPESYEINLAKEWNLISIPRPVAGNTSPLAGLAIADKIYYFDNASAAWKYSFRSGVNWTGDIVVEPGKGYWVHATQSDKWLVSLKAADPTDSTIPKYTLTNGWNMIGYTNYKSNDRMLLNDYLKSIGASNWLKAYRYNKDSQAYDTPAVNSADNPGFDFVEAGRGYWVCIGTDATKCTTLSSTP